MANPSDFPASLTDPESARAARDAFQAELTARAEEMLEDPTPEDEPWAEIGLTIAVVYALLHEDEDDGGIYIPTLGFTTFRRRLTTAEMLAKLEPYLRQHATSKFNAAQEAAIEQATRLFPQAKKRWDSQRDERVRETHQHAHGQIRSLRSSFRVGAALMPYPGWPFGPPEEVFGCRCFVTLVL